MSAPARRRKAGGCDSLEIVEIVMKIEDPYHVIVPEGLEQTARTVRDPAEGLMAGVRGSRPKTVREPAGPQRPRSHRG